MKLLAVQRNGIAILNDCWTWDVEVLDGPLGYNPESEIVDLTGGVKFKENDIKRFYTWTDGVEYQGYLLENLAKGSTFKLTNVGRTKSGKNVNLKFTVLGDYSNDPTFKIYNDIPSYLLFDGGKKGERDHSIGMSVINMDGFKLD